MMTRRSKAKTDLATAPITSRTLNSETTIHAVKYTKWPTLNEKFVFLHEVVAKPDGFLRLVHLSGCASQQI